MYLSIMNLLIAVGIALPGYIAIRYFATRKRAGSRGAAREISLFLFILLMAGLLALVLWPGRAPNSAGDYWAGIAERIYRQTEINLKPFYTISRFMKYGPINLLVVNVLGNIVIFMPIGFFLPLLWKKWQSVWKAPLAGAVFSIGIETAQLFINRTVDIDDVILNALGAVLGFALWRLLRLIFPGIAGLGR